MLDIKKDRAKTIESRHLTACSRSEALRCRFRVLFHSQGDCFEAFLDISFLIFCTAYRIPPPFSFFLVILVGLLEEGKLTLPIQLIHQRGYCI